ncbi:MAG: hypothetical protein QF464_07065, partial [Myxococcota bacterium]|nr:hypothetical protein [Myxococcota bacterium]
MPKKWTLVVGGAAVGLAVGAALILLLPQPSGVPVSAEGSYLAANGIYRLTPASRHHQRSANEEWPFEEFTTNNEGFRDEDFSPDGPKILYVGDSFVFGIGLRSQETIDTQLEGLFREEGVEIPVFNMGIPGYNLESQLILAEEMVDKFRPETVICNYIVGDDLV